MATKTEIQARQRELARWAREKNWRPRGFGAWTSGTYTVAVSVRGYPKRDFTLTNCRTLDDWHMPSLEDVDRFLEFVRCSGVEPG